MILYISLGLSFILLFISGIHFFWALGGHWGMTSALPTPNDGEMVINPGKLACLVVAIGFLCLGAFVLMAGKVIPNLFSIGITQKGLLAICAIFFIRAIGDFKYVGIFKKIKNTSFAENDTRFYSPLCAVLGIMALSIYILNA